MISSDEQFMRLALAQAEAAFARGETPVGAVVANASGEVIAAAGNERELSGDPTAHAEVLAVRAAAQVVGSWRLTGCSIYVTLEPCPMCAGALVHARLDRLVYGPQDPRAGAAYSLYNIVQDPRLNHRMEITTGVLADECARLLRDFFEGRRPDVV
jgi:tRNA(adenine34) deaminase